MQTKTPYTVGRRAITAALLLGACGLAHASHYTFYLGEHTDFSACGGSNLNSITPQLADYLRDHGWSGYHFMNASAWPQDHREDSFGGGGIDASYGDAKNLSAYAGHGYTDPRYGLAYGTPHNGKCSLDIDAEMRLGERVSYGGNGQASFFMAMTSCTVYQPKSVAVWVNSGAMVGLAQVLGFHDSPYIHDDEPRLFAQNVRSSTSKTNRNEWLDQMDNCGPWYYFCSNSPMVLSVGESQSHASNIHYNANIWYAYTDPWIDWPAWYYYTYRDNGSGPCY